MIWLSLRQFRAQGAAVYAGAAVLAVALLVTGLAVADLSEETGGGFTRALSGEPFKELVLTLASIAMLVLPALIGAFWGAPLVARELEAGTHRLVWSQSVTRTRWLATRMGMTGLATIVVAAALGLALAWWCKPIDAAMLDGQRAEGLLGLSRMSPVPFATRGIVPMGYAVFAFAVGVAAGALVRRVLPAMAITLAIVVAVQIAVPTMIRPHLGPASLTTAITEQNLRGISLQIDATGKPLGPVRDLTVEVDRPGAWIVGNETIDASGNVLETLPSWVSGCAGGPPPPPGAAPARPRRNTQPCFDRLAVEGYRQRVTYQPHGRFWSFQAYETAAFLGLAGLIAWFSFWWVRRRVA